MGLESANYITGLVTSNPDGGDARSTADDHLRLVKLVLKNSFPMIAGAVSASAAAVTYTNDLSASVQAQLNTLRDGSATAANAINSRYANSASMAANIGTIPAAQVAALNAANTFTTNQTVSRANPYVLLADTAAAADQGKVFVQSSGEELLIGLANDAVSLTTNAMRVTRTGLTIDGIYFGGTVYANGNAVWTTGDSVDAALLGGTAAAGYAKLGSPQSFTKGQAITQVDLSGVGTFTPNCDDSTMYRITLTGTPNVMAAPNAPRSGMVLTFHLVQGGSGTNLVSWSTSYKFAGGSPPTLSTAVGQVDVLAFQYDATSGVWRQAGLAVS